jgi:hypothetical protein
MLRDRTLAASRSRRATGAATRGEIFSVSSTGIPFHVRVPPGRRDAAPASRLYTIRTVMQIINLRFLFPRATGNVYDQDAEQ